MDPERTDDTRSQETDFAAVWSSDGVTRSFAPTATGVPVDLPFLFSGGQPFGPYLIVRPIGKGGMGQVYEAEEIESGRRVAVKVLSRGIGDDEERERFLQEGRLAASLSHPNTVYVFGTTEVQGFPVIAMELAPSGTLKDLVMPGQPMAVSPAADAILQVIDGLEAAASLGILHRDVKPSNCFVAADGRVLVGDFGLSIATLARGEGSGDAQGTILGTPGFASPEQLRGESLDVRSDIYSVGATIYYLLAGKAPFDDPNLQTMMTRVAAEPPPPLALSRPDVPSRLASVVGKCLAKKPADRYASYAALRRALEPFRSASVMPAPLGRRFLAGWVDSICAAIALLPINMFLGAEILDTSHPGTVVLATLPSVVVSLAYYTLLEGWFGCGAGKALFNLRVVTADEYAPGFRRAFFRAAVFVIPPQIVRIAIGYFATPLAQPGFNTNNATQSVFAAMAILLSTIVFAIQFSTVRRCNGYAGLHDLASGTRVVVRPRAMEVRTASIRSSRATGPSPAGREHVGPYFVPAGTRAAARASASSVVVEGFDDRLRRAVWIQLLPSGAAPVPAWRRDLGRPGRTRWLSGRRTDGDAWDAYEAVEGEPLSAAGREPQPWSRVRHWVADLALELAAGLEDGSLPPIDANRIWIGADDRERVCEWAPPSPLRGYGETGPPDAPDPPPATLDLQSAQRLVYGAATASLGGEVPLPLPARAFLLALRDGAFPSAKAMAAAASELLRGSASFPRGRRATQMAICAVVPVVMPIAVLFAVRLISAQQTSDPRAFQFTACVNQLAAYEKIGDAKLTPEQKQQRELIEVFVAEYLEAQTKEAAAVARTFPIVARSTNDYHFAERAIARHPVRAPAEVKKAEGAVADLTASNSKGLTKLQSPLGRWALANFMIIWSAAVVACVALVGALVTRSGFTLRGAGAALVTNRGEPASRVRALVRAVVTWLPVVPALILLRAGPKVQSAALWNTIAQTVVLALFAACAIWALKNPARGLQDRLAGTWIVPR